MPATTYSIENAKTGRSSCKKCKEKIGTGDLRIGSHVHDEDTGVHLTSWFHPECFNLPRKLVNEGITPEDFVQDMLEDNSSGKVLDSEPENIIAAVASKPAKKEKKEHSRIEHLKANLALLRKEEEENDNDEGPPRKKAKKGLGEKERAEAEVYAIYAPFKNDELKDVLRWNQQLVGGTKEELLTRVIDGHLYGRITLCPLCSEGRLKLDITSDRTEVVCRGTFDEVAQARIQCSFKCPAADAPRALPWYSEKPTEDEEAAMKAELEGNKDGIIKAEESKSSVLIDLASKLDWDLGSKAGIQAASAAIIDLCTNNDPKVALPTDAKKARMEVGRLIVQNKEKSAIEVLQVIIDKFGYAKAKEAAAKRKHETMSAACNHPGNVGAFEAISELADLYFKEGNRNAGGTYKKVSAAIAKLDFEITEENAKGLGKGKTKIENIGKGSAEKLYEFAKDGKIEKLEEKRAAAQ